MPIPPLTFVNIERDGPDCDADHAFGVVEKLNGLGVQGKVISVLCVGDKKVVLVSQVLQGTDKRQAMKRVTVHTKMCI